MVSFMASRTIAFLAGVLAVQQLPRLPLPDEWLIAAAAALIIGGAAFRFRHTSFARIALLSLFLIAGFAWAAWRGALLLAEALPAGLEGEDLVVVGTLRDLPVIDAGRTRFDLIPESVEREGRPLAFRGRLRLAWYEGAPPLHAGERWRLAVRLKRPHGMANPGGFDYEAHLFQERIVALGYVRKGTENVRLAEAGLSIDGWRDGIRQAMEGALGDAPHAGVLIALAIGDGSHIGNEEWELFRATGITHLMAISGLHVGMVAALAAWGVRRLWRAPRLIHRLPAQKAAVLAGFCAALFYGLLAGFSVPTQRTVITIGAVALALILTRESRPRDLLAVACWAVLIYDPLAVLAPGFWLSFGAVALILYGIGGRLAPEGLWWRFGRLQWVLGLGLTPLLLAFFGSVSVASPLANLVAVPWISLLVVPLTLVGTGMLFLWPWAGALLLQLTAGLMGLLWPVLEGLAHWVPPVSLPQPPLWLLPAALVGTALLLAPRGWPGRWLGLLWCLPLFLFPPARPAEGEVWLTLLDVGQGLAAVVETRDHLLLFDTGPTLGPELDAGEAAVEPFLRSRGWRRVDLLLVSHGDDDHAGGARTLAAALPVKRLLAAVPERLAGAGAADPCRRGQEWVWERVRFRIVHPDQEEGDNDGSCVLRVEAPGGALLLTGDIEARAEKALVASGEALRSRVLVAPHHGSRTSSSREFLDAVHPELALFPVGYRNRFHFPSGAVVARYDALRIRRLETAREGAITVRLGADGRLATESRRSVARRYWQAP
jgi:competence protein ComEC